MKKQSEKTARIRRRKKQEFVNRLGGKCCICGYNKSLNSLTFHHLIPMEKDSKIADLIANASYEKIEKEIEKCILLCSNCHGEIHDLGIDFSIKIKHLEWFEIKCETCGNKFKTTDIVQKFCRDKCRIIGVSKVKKRPTKNELKNMIENNSWTSIAQFYKVSDNTIRKWAKKYKLI